MKHKDYTYILRLTIMCYLILLVFYHFFYMPFEVQAFKKIDLLPPIAREYLPLVFPLAELLLIYGIFWGKKKKVWAVSLYYFLLIASCVWPILLLNPWKPNCDCKGLLDFADDIYKHNIINLTVYLILFAISIIYLHQQNNSNKV